MWPCGQSTMTSWARRNFRCVYTHFWCIHYRTGHQWFDLHLSVDFCRHEWIGLICRAPHRLCQQASIPVHRSFNFSPTMLESPSMDVKSVATLWFALSGALSLWFCAMRVSILWSFGLSKYASVSRGFYFDHYYFVFLLIHWVSPGAELEKNRRGATLYSI